MKIDMRYVCPGDVIQMLVHEGSIGVLEEVGSEA